MATRSGSVKPRTSWGKGLFGIKTQLFGSTVIHWFGCWLGGGWLGLGAGILAGLLGKCLLEAVNYIEHYGLARAPKSRVEPHHSWNSASAASQFFMFNISRHSDHHANGLKPYQKLLSHKSLPSLPHGYLTMILLSLAPWVFFKVMKQPLRNWDMAYGLSNDKNA